MDIQKFFDERFGNIRAFKDVDGTVWFVGKDIAKALGYEDTSQALRKHVWDRFKRGRRIDATPGGPQTMIVITEPGVYQLIFGSKLKSATEFQKWVFEEVLPSIRKDGAYIDPNHDSVRALNKMIRNYETSAIARLIEYGKRQGYIINETQVYKNLTYRTQTELCGILSGERDKVESSDLINLIGAESIVVNVIYKGILNSLKFSTIYRSAVKAVKYHMLENIEFVYNDETDIISVNVKEKKNSILVTWDGIKIKVPKEV